MAAGQWTRRRRSSGHYGSPIGRRTNNAGVCVAEQTAAPMVGHHLNGKSYLSDLIECPFLRRAALQLGAPASHRSGSPAACALAATGTSGPINWPMLAELAANTPPTRRCIPGGARPEPRAIRPAPGRHQARPPEWRAATIWAASPRAPSRRPAVVCLHSGRELCDDDQLAATLRAPGRPAVAPLATGSPRLSAAHGRLIDGPPGSHVNSPLPTWICIQQPTLSPAKSARTMSSMSTGNGLKVTAFSYWSCQVQRSLRAWSYTSCTLGSYWITIVFSK